jgi:hypothetical protein
MIVAFQWTAQQQKGWECWRQTNRRDFLPVSLTVNFLDLSPAASVVTIEVAIKKLDPKVSNGTKARILV